MSAKILEKIGLKPEEIAKHVVAVEPPLKKWSNKTRAKYLAMGLTSAGKPRKKPVRPAGP